MRKIFLKLFFLSLIIFSSLSGCKTDNTTSTAKTTDNTSDTSSIAISGSITGKILNRSGNSFRYSILESNALVPFYANSSDTEQLYVVAIDASGGSLITKTTNRAFSIDASSDKEYTLIFLNSAGQFVGVLTDGKDPTAFKSAGDLALGNLSFKDKKAIPSDKKPIRNVKTDIETVIKKDASNDEYNLSGVRYSNQTTNINLNLFLENEDKKIMIEWVDKDGDCTSDGDVTSDEYVLMIFSSEYDSTNDRTNYIKSEYPISDYSNGTISKLESKTYMYFTDEKRIYFKEVKCDKNNNVVESPMNYQEPSHFTVGKPIKTGSKADEKDRDGDGDTTEIIDYYETVEEVYPSLKVPGFSGTHKGFVVKQEYRQKSDGAKHQEPDYRWYIYGIRLVGENSHTAKNIDALSRGKLYMENSKRKMGTKPSWLNQNFINNLPKTVTCN